MGPCVDRRGWRVRDLCVGGELARLREGKLGPVSFFSDKLEHF